MKCLSLDFGGSSVKYGLVDSHARLSRTGKLPAPVHSRQEFIETVSALFALHKDEVDGIAISLPGYIDSGTGILVGSGAYQALYGCCIPDLLKETCSVPITVENDGKCGALSELWGGALSDCDDGVVLILGSAIAGGVIKGKKIHAGKGNTAGEFSFLLVDEGKFDYSAMAMMHCGTVGMAYKLCKLKNLNLSIQNSCQLLQRFDKLFADQYPTFAEKPSDIKVTGEQIMQWVEQKDPDALAVYDEMISSLAMLIFNIQVTYAPERIVIGGGLSRSQMLFDDLQKMMKKYYESLFMFGKLQADVVKSKYLEDCNLLGATYNFMMKYNQTFFDGRSGEAWADETPA